MGYEPIHQQGRGLCVLLARGPWVGWGSPTGDQPSGGRAREVWLGRSTHCPLCPSCGSREFTSLSGSGQHEVATSPAHLPVAKKQGASPFPAPLL